MAKYQYRIQGQFDGVSSVGNALVAVVNKLGSGKRMTIRSVEALPTYFYDQSYYGVEAVLTRCSLLGVGEVLTPTRMDSNAAAWPSNVFLYRNAVVSVTGDTILSRIDINSHSMIPALNWYGIGVQGVNDGPFGGKCVFAAKRNGAATIERIAIRPGETVALRPYPYGNGCVTATGLYGVTATLKVRGTPDRTYTLAYNVHLNGGAGQALFAVNNTSGSTVVELMEFGVTQLGSGTTTPYYQIVPINTVEADPYSDAVRQVPVFKMDSNYPDPSSWLAVIKDAPVFPYGVPSEYVAQGSGLAGKGFNYLHTKDFVGPTWRSLFPEVNAHGNVGSTVGAMEAALSKYKRGEQNLRRGAGIVLREGQGMAICVAAETVTSSTSPPPPQRQNMEFSITLDIENASQPYLTLNGIVSGSDIVVLDAGTETEYQNINAYSGSSWAWGYDQDVVTDADVCVYKQGYVPFTARNLALGATGATIPVQQVADRNFSA